MINADLEATPLGERIPGGFRRPLRLLAAVSRATDLKKFFTALGKNRGKQAIRRNLGQ